MYSTGNILIDVLLFVLVLVIIVWLIKSFIH